MLRLLTMIATLLIAGCASATATAQATGDGPPLIVGRLSAVEGDVQIWRAEEDADGNWDVAQINDVVTVGTGLYTGPGGRSELRVGPSSYRLASGSRGGFNQLDYGGAVFNLEHGSLNVYLARPGNGEFAAVTVHGTRIDLVAPGTYRVDAGDGSGQVRVSTLSGQATVQAGGNAIQVVAGQALLAGPGLGSVYEQATATAFDQWAQAREERYREVHSARYVSPYMTGYEELDSHGDWIPDATYGNVWVPRVVPTGWAPYRSGQWRWVRPWGWTWVDHAPWGFAPFHYGRWVTIGHRWCWWPGSYVARPVWAPALVGFVGGSNVSVSVGHGGPVVGWYPLAPWHRYRPHYPHSTTYITVINQTVINSPPRGIPPRHHHDGATMVPGPRFREPIMKVALPVRPNGSELQHVAPPPRNIGVTKVADDGMMRRPTPVQPLPRSAEPAAGYAPTLPPSNGVVAAPTRKVPAPTRVMPPIMAEPIPNRGIAAPAPLPGNDPAPLAPPKFNRVPPTYFQTTPLPRPAPDIARPAPRARIPQEILPQAEQQPRGVPGEPARFPQGAPPTIRQPSVPAAQPAPRSSAPMVPVAPTAAAPAARSKQQVLRSVTPMSQAVR